MIAGYTISLAIVRDTTKEREAAGLISHISMSMAVAPLLVEARFWGYALCTAFSIGAFYTFLAGAPLVARTVVDISTATLGVLIGIMFVASFAGLLSAAWVGHADRTTAEIMAPR